MLNIIDNIIDNFIENELCEDEDIKQLESKLDLLIKKVANVNEELAFDIDDICGEITSAYVECCFKGGFNTAVELKRSVGSPVNKIKGLLTTF